MLRRLLFVITATAAAAAGAYEAHDVLGLSRHAVRSDALLTAAGAGGLLMIALFSDKLGGRKK